MSFPKNLKAQLFARFEELIVEGANILENAEDVPPLMGHGVFGERQRIVRDGYKRMDGATFLEWRVKATTLLSKVITDESMHSPQLVKGSTTREAELILRLRCASLRMTEGEDTVAQRSTTTGG